MKKFLLTCLLLIVGYFTYNFLRKPKRDSLKEIETFFSYNAYKPEGWENANTVWYNAYDKVLIIGKYSIPIQEVSLSYTNQIKKEGTWSDTSHLVVFTCKDNEGCLNGAKLIAIRFNSNESCIEFKG